MIVSIQRQQYSKQIKTIQLSSNSLLISFQTKHVDIFLYILKYTTKYNKSITACCVGSLTATSSNHTSCHFPNVPSENSSWNEKKSHLSLILSRKFISMAFLTPTTVASTCNLGLARIRYREHISKTSPTQVEHLCTAQ